MDSGKIRDKFLNFFEKQGHKIVPSSSLVPTDPSVLLTTAGMQQFKPYYTLEKNPQEDFGTHRTSSIQKSFRTSDIDEIGDKTHLTFFEMLGNFSFGPVGSDDPGDFGRKGYFKKSAIPWAYEFITKEMGLEIDYVSIFKGEKGIVRDDESEKIWKSIDPEIEIKEFGREDNFWGPTGEEGPCGPTTEIYVDGVETWNIVFNEYYCLPSVASVKEGRLKKLENPGVDTGMGLERLAMVMQKKNNIFETDLFVPLIEIIKNIVQIDDVKKQRIVADHLRASLFLIEDGVLPSNKEAGYILRRLLRRVIRYEKIYGFGKQFYRSITKEIIKVYEGFYQFNKDKILQVIFEEREKFLKTLERGLKEFEKMKPKGISGEEAFYLYETFGFPFDLTQDLAKEQGIEISEEEFEAALKKHQEASRSGASKKFGGHGFKEGGEASEKITRLHTSTHLLQSALGKILGEETRQMGSDINEDRTRFDFNFSRKLTNQELEKIENLVNEVIQKNLPVSMEEMSYDQALKSGALSALKEPYPEKVKVYSIEDFSKEICGGPHVKSTGEVGKFKIKKEESVASGVRRIRAVID